MKKAPRLTIYHAKQCDPKRCTGLKLKRHGLARAVTSIRFLPRRAIVLNPFGSAADSGFWSGGVGLQLGACAKGSFDSRERHQPLPAHFTGGKPD